ncbi:hypothetical protein CPB86DRAFT_456233, partial [Serendipita vermifera]
TAWEIYNHKASEIDRELIKDWNDSLNTLLIFVSRYNQKCCTAFNWYTGSPILCYPDRIHYREYEASTRGSSRDDTRYPICHIQPARQQFFPAFQRIEYETPDYAVIVNGLLFTSLSCSLIAALLAVLALQWVASYDMGLNTSSARKRALQRHTRWTGIERWKMGEIIASLPLLIFVSLFLFFIGIADWLWHMNRAISGIVIGGIGIGCLLYMITNLISIIQLDAPFRTPVSKGLVPLYRGTIAWMRFLFLSFPSEVLNKNEGRKSFSWNRIREIWGSIHKDVSVAPQNFAKYEEKEVERKEDAEMESLLWLANSIEVTIASRDMFLSLIRGFMKLSPELWMRRDKMDGAPWQDIFTVLCNPYFGKNHNEIAEEEWKIAVEVYEAYSVIPSMLPFLMFRNFHYTMTGANTLLRPVGSISEYRHFYHWIWELVDTLELMCKSISSIKANYFYFILLEVQQEWSNLTGQHRRSILRSLAHACAIPSGDTPNPFIIPTRSLDVVLDLVGQYYNATSHIIREGTTVDRYISAVRLMKEGKDKKLGDNINRSIQQLLLAHIATINLSMSSAEDEILPLLERLSKIISSEPLALCDQERDKFIQVLAHIYGHEGTRGAKETVGKTLLTGLQYSHAQDDQLPDRFVGSVVAIDEYLSRSISLERYYEIISCVTSVLSEHDPCTPEASLRETLIHIKDPVISFWIAQHCPEDWEFEALVNPDSRKWNKDVGHALSLIGTCRMKEILPGLCKMFLRTIIIDGPPSIRQYVVRILELLSMNEEVIGVLFICGHCTDCFTRNGCKYCHLQLSTTSWNGIITGDMVTMEIF